ncbi:2-C-methyl-D-erythritol 4-phosphate cytidylyltransferase [Spongorhabdus nitratireducens]
MSKPLSSDAMPAVWCVVPAAGIGSRMKSSLPKQYLKLGDQTVLEHTLQRLLAFPQIQRIVVAVSPEDTLYASLPVMALERIMTVDGGAERYLSVLNGLAALDGLAAANDWVMVHDAARPCVRLGDLQQLLNEAGNDETGGLLACPVSDTIKREQPAASKRSGETIDRSQLWHAMTPQMFRKQALHDALRNAIESGAAVTDEASAIELAGQSPMLVTGHSDNIKITRPEDLALAAFLLSRQQNTEAETVKSAPVSSTTISSTKTAEPQETDV